MNHKEFFNAVVRMRNAQRTYAMDQGHWEGVIDNEIEYVGTRTGVKGEQPDEPLGVKLMNVMKLAKNPRDGMTALMDVMAVWLEVEGGINPASEKAINAIATSLRLRKGKLKELEKQIIIEDNDNGTKQNV